MHQVNTCDQCILLTVSRILVTDLFWAQQIKDDPEQCQKIKINIKRSFRGLFQVYASTGN